MKLIGLVGGLTWVSTQDYYRHLNSLVNEKLGGDEAAEIIICSVNFGEIKRRTLSGDWDGIAEIITKAAQTLEAAGASCILLGANTMHRIAPQVQEKLRVPLIHIADSTGKAIRELGLKKVLLLGTKYTMAMDSYKSIIESYGAKVVIPDAEDVEMVNSAIYMEMAKGLFLPATKKKYVDLIENQALKGVDGVILGCTEIPQLILPEDVSIPIFDTAYLHAKEAVDFAIEI